MEAIMVQLAMIQKECFDANKIVYEEYIIVQKLYVLRGGMGWKVNV